MTATRSEIIMQAARAAGEAVRTAVPSAGVVHKEGRANVVTAADKASEKKIIDLIASNFPDDAILSEETESKLRDILEVKNLWVIDPLDGTNNFRNQQQYCCVSIGYIERGTIKAGAVYDPFRNELFSAEKGKGASLNGARISVSTESELNQATVATDNSYDPSGTQHNLELLLRIKPSPWVMMKGSGVLAMCEVAAGRINLYFHSTLKPWDNAAAFLLVQEAGGVARGHSGEDIDFLSPRVIVGSVKLVKQCVEAFGVR